MYRDVTYSVAQERNGIDDELEPLERMRQSDADVAIMFLTAAIKYTRPVDGSKMDSVPVNIASSN
jgi:hypothetical protein